MSFHERNFKPTGYLASWLYQAVSQSILLSEIVDRAKSVSKTFGLFEILTFKGLSPAFCQRPFSC